MYEYFTNIRTNSTLAVLYFLYMLAGESMKQYLIVSAIALSSFLAGKYLVAPRVETKTVTKIVEVEKKQQKKDKVVKSKKTKKPDGTVVTETTVTEKTNTVTDTSLKINSATESKSGGKVSVGVLAIKSADKFSAPTEFGATVSVPVFGSVKAQALGTTDKKIGVGLALEF